MKGWRTIAFNLALLLLSLTDYLTGGEVIRAVISDPQDAALAVSLVTAVNLVLRRLTTGPVGGSGK